MRQEVRTLDFKSNRAEYSYTTDLVAGNIYGICFDEFVKIYLHYLDIELSVSVMERSATPAKVILNKSVSFRACMFISFCANFIME
jgi:hypothetical protein